MVAWRSAKFFQKQFGSALEAMYVQPWMFSVAGMGLIDPYLAGESERDAVAELQLKLGPDALIRGDIGTIESSIVKESASFDMLAVGTHSRTGVERALRGSVAETLIRASNKPVLVTKRPLTAVRRVLAPVNFEPYSWDAFEAAAQAAAAFAAELTVLHVIGPTLSRGADVAGPGRLLEEWIRELPETVRDACRPLGRIEFGSPAERIANAATDCDLVVIAAHRKGLLADAFGTTAERVLRHCAIPILAIPSGEGRE